MKKIDQLKADYDAAIVQYWKRGTMQDHIDMIAAYEAWVTKSRKTNSWFGGMGTSRKRLAEK